MQFLWQWWFDVGRTKGMQPYVDIADTTDAQRDDEVVYVVVNMRSVTRYELETINGDDISTHISADVTDSTPDRPHRTCWVRDADR